MLSRVRIEQLMEDVGQMLQYLEAEGEGAEACGQRIRDNVTSMIQDRESCGLCGDKGSLSESRMRYLRDKVKQYPEGSDVPASAWKGIRVNLRLFMAERAHMLREIAVGPDVPGEGLQTWRREQIEQSYLALGYRAGEPRPALVDAIKEMLAHVETNTSRLKADVAERDQELASVRSDIEFLRQMREKQAAFKKAVRESPDGKSIPIADVPRQTGLREMMERAEAANATPDQFQQRMKEEFDRWSSANKQFQDALYREVGEEFLSYISKVQNMVYDRRQAFNAVQEKRRESLAGTEQPAIVEPKSE